jgi:hypothetical protein
MDSNQHKEHIINDIKELDIKQQNIENKLQELRIFYITNKENYNYDYKLAKTFFDNLKNFIENDFSYLESYIESNVKKLSGNNYDVYNYKIFNYSKHYESLIENYLVSLNNYYSGSYRPIPDTPEQYKNDKLKVDNNFNFICNYGEERLILGMIMNEKKLNYYDNLLKLYYPVCEKSEIKNIMDLYPEENIMKLTPEHEKSVIKKKQYSVLASVIFLIMIVFYVMIIATVVLLLNPKHNYNTTALYHPMQCSQSTILIDKHKKLRDIMII